MKARLGKSKASVAVAIVAFVLSLVPFSAITTPSGAAKAEPVRTEWVARRRAVTRYVTYHQAYSTPGTLSCYPRAVQHHTRLITLNIAACARGHAPPPMHVLRKTPPSSGHEDPIPSTSTLA